MTPAVIERDALLYAMVKKKGYVRMHTNFGDLNFELHCDLVPKTCHNFIAHCRDGYYTGTSECVSAWVVGCECVGGLV